LRGELLDCSEKFQELRCRACQSGVVNLRGMGHLLRNDIDGKAIFLAMEAAYQSPKQGRNPLDNNQLALLSSFMNILGGKSNRFMKENLAALVKFDVLRAVFDLFEDRLLKVWKRRVDNSKQPAARASHNAQQAWPLMRTSEVESRLDKEDVPLCTDDTSNAHQKKKKKKNESRCKRFRIKDLEKLVQKRSGSPSGAAQALLELHEKLGSVTETLHVNGLDAASIGDPFLDAFMKIQKSVWIPLWRNQSKKNRHCCASCGAKI